MPFQRESPIKRTKIASMGGKAAQASGKAHKYDSAKASEAAKIRWRNKRLADQKELEQHDQR